MPPTGTNGNWSTPNDLVPGRRPCHPDGVRRRPGAGLLVFIGSPLLSLTPVLSALWLKMLFDGLVKNNAGAAGMAAILVAGRSSPTT